MQIKVSFTKLLMLLGIFNLYLFYIIIFKILFIPLKIWGPISSQSISSYILNSYNVISS